MSEDAQGLKVHGVLADTELGNEMHQLLKMEAIRDSLSATEPRVSVVRSISNPNHSG
jgi:hypothetical protein